MASAACGGGCPIFRVFARSRRRALGHANDTPGGHPRGGATPLVAGRWPRRRRRNPTAILADCTERDRSRRMAAADRQCEFVLRLQDIFFAIASIR